MKRQYTRPSRLAAAVVVQKWIEHDRDHVARFELEPTYISNRVENWRLFTAPFNVRTASGEHLEWNVIPEFERLDARVAQISRGGDTATRLRWVTETLFLGLQRRFRWILKPGNDFLVVINPRVDAHARPFVRADVRPCVIEIAVHFSILTRGARAVAGAAEYE